MRRIPCRFLVSPPSLATVLLMSAVTLHAQPGALTFDVALQLAAEHSQQLVAQSAAEDAAREMAVAAGQAPDPMLMAGVNNVPVNGADEFSLSRDFMTMRSIGFSRELTRHDKRDARSARFTSEAEAARAAHSLALAQLQSGTAEAWLERYYRERAHEALLRQRDEAALQIEAAEVAFGAGLGPQADVFAARLALAKIEDRIIAHSRELEGATIRLARWIGADAMRPLSTPPALDRLALHDDLEEALARHPEIALMTEREQVARAEAEIARTNKRSDWTVEVMYSQRGPDFSNMMSVNVSKPLQWREANRQNRELAAKLSIARQMRAEREEAIREHFAEASALLAEWRGGRERLDRYADTLVPLAGQRTAAATTAYRGGTGTLGAVLDARVAETDTRLEQLLLEMEAATLWAQLTYLLPVGGSHE